MLVRNKMTGVLVANYYDGFVREIAIIRVSYRIGGKRPRHHQIPRHAVVRALALMFSSE
jgi:hypothetical protein